jgi:hypothetical protein
MVITSDLPDGSHSLKESQYYDAKFRCEGEICVSKW